MCLRMSVYLIYSLKDGQGVKLVTHPRLVPRSKNGWSCTSNPPIRLHGVVRGAQEGQLKGRGRRRQHIKILFGLIIFSLIARKRIRSTSDKDHVSNIRNMFITYILFNEETEINVLAHTLGFACNLFIRL